MFQYICTCEKWIRRKENNINNKDNRIITIEQQQGYNITSPVISKTFNKEESTCTRTHILGVA